MNSTRGRHLIDGELPLASRHACGHLRLCAGMEKLLRVVSVCLDHVIKTGTPSSSHFLLPLFPPVATAQLRRARAVAVALSLSQQSLSQFRLLLANPADQSWATDFVEKRCVSPFFLASPWPAFFGVFLSLLSLVPASPYCCDAL